MASLASFVFLNTSSTTTTSSTFYVPYGAEEVVLQVKSSGTPDITVKGKVDRENGDFVTLSAINMTGYQTVDKIAVNGIYSVAASGIREMQVVNGGSAGSVTVFGEATGEG